MRFQTRTLRFRFVFPRKNNYPAIEFRFSPLFWQLYTELHNRVHATLQRVEFSFFFNERPRLIVVNNNIAKVTSKGGRVKTVLQNYFNVHNYVLEYFCSSFKSLKINLYIKKIVWFYIILYQTRHTKGISSFTCWNVEHGFFGNHN